MESDPGLFYPQVMMGVRDTQVFALYGEQKNTGDIAAPLFPTNGIPLFIYSIGFDGGATGVAGAGTGLGVTSTVAGTSASTITASSAAGITSVVLASGTGYTVGGYIIIDVNNTVTPTTAEIRKIVTVVTNTITFDQPTNFTHAASCPTTYLAAASVKAFVHTVVPGNTLPSVTIEKNIGGYESLQFQGARVGKYSLKCQASDTEAAFTATMQSKSVVPLTAAGNTISATTLATTALVQGTSYQQITTTAAITCLQGTWLTLTNTTGGVQYVCTSAAVNASTTVPCVGFIANAAYAITTTTVTNATVTPVSVVNEMPFIFAEATLTAFGQTLNQVTNVQVDIDNGLVPTWTMNETHALQFLTPVTRHINGQLDIVFTSLDDPTYGYWNTMTNEVQGTLTLNFTHPFSPNYGVSITLQQINLAKYADDLKLTGIVMTSLNFEASYALGASPPSTLAATVTDGSYLPY